MDYLSVKDVAALVRCNEETIRRRIRQQKLEAELLSRKQGYMIPVWQILNEFGVTQRDIDEFVSRVKADEARTRAEQVTRTALTELTRAQAYQQTLIHKAERAVTALRQTRTEALLDEQASTCSEITSQPVTLTPEQQIAVLESQIQALTEQIKALNQRLDDAHRD